MDKSYKFSYGRIFVLGLGFGVISLTLAIAAVFFGPWSILTLSPWWLIWPQQPNWGYTLVCITSLPSWQRFSPLPFSDLSWTILPVRPCSPWQPLPFS